MSIFYYQVTDGRNKVRKVGVTLSESKSAVFRTGPPLCALLRSLNSILSSYLCSIIK